MLPPVRASVWAEIQGRLGAVEQGLVVVLEGVDCSGGQFGLVEALARDAQGGAVLVLVAIDGDGLLAARAHAACDFLARIGASLPAAVPEAHLVAGAPGRVLVIGTETGAASLDLLRCLALPGLEICRLETFRIGGSERVVARWLACAPAAAAAAPGALPAASQPEFEVSGERRRDWEELRQMCERIDPAVRWDGDRFSRRATWQGRPLGRIEMATGHLFGVDAHGERHALRTAGETRRFVDRMLRRYAHLAGVTFGGAEARAVEAPRRVAAETLSATLAATRLSPVEYSALGGPTAAGGVDGEHGNIADTVARIVTAPEPAWPPDPRPAERRTD
ncbi:MAG: hypothetical protein KF830_03280 [Planctomycetes bacterium]|nr:hypothetical protein [Planctomycetota bacterium]